MTRKWFVFAIGMILVVNLAGCEAFTRKFTRKSKKDKNTVEMVLAPEEWKGPKMTKEERYRQYLLFWKSWHDELENALVQNSAMKKKADCCEQAIKNLNGMRSLLNESKQKQLDVYIRQMVELYSEIKSDIYGMSANSFCLRLDKLRMHIQEGFTYNDIKNDLI
jgi:tRNA U38,U39,U40 pseudouridine synthase TruA